jgi:hypothetical protein
MTTRDFAISDSLKSKGVTRIFLKNDEVIVKINNNEINTSLDPDIKTTINSIRNNLDAFIINNDLMEQIIFIISENLKQSYELQINNNNVLNKSTHKEENITFAEWRTTLLQYYTDLKIAVENNFPNLWDSLEFELAIKNILHINKCTLPFAGIVLGSPSSLKTLGIELFRNIGNTFYSDNFSAKSFVSHNTAVKREQLAQIDLLPKIKDKLFLTPELSPTFAKKDEELMEVLGILIRILDGKGYESDTGAQGHRGYKGDYMFVWIGAAVEISRKVHKYLSTLGPKLYFYRVPKSQRTEDQYFEAIKGKSFQVKINEIQILLEKYLEWFNKCPIKVDLDEKEDNYDNENNEEEYTKVDAPIKIDWNNEKDEDKALRIIIKLANLLAPLRGILTTWETRESQGTEYSYSLPIIEEPDRAITQLRNLARGAALTRGRNYVTIEDMPLIIKVVLSTASIERVRILDLLLNTGGELSTSQIELFLNISKPTSRRTMAEFKGLGIVDLIEGEFENSEIKIKLKPKFSWFLSSEFKALREGFTPDYKNEDKIDLLAELKEKYPLAL